MEWCCHRTTPSPSSIHATTRTTYTHDDYTTQHNTHNDTHDDDSHLEFTKQDNTQPPSFFPTRARARARANPQSIHFTPPVAKHISADGEPSWPVAIHRAAKFPLFYPAY